MPYNRNNDPLYRTAMRVSIHGPRLGLDDDNFLVGPPGLRKKVTPLTTAASTAVPAHGYVYITGLGSSQGPCQYTLDAPIPGIEVTLHLACTSTGSYQFLSTANGASIRNSSAGTTSGVVNLIGPGGSVTLVGLTTAAWAVKAEGSIASTAPVKNVSFTTST